jgi:hypothetical protein
VAGGDNIEVKEVSFEGWGYRELDIAAKLLDKYSDRPTESGIEGDLKLGLNTSSGCVFLFDDDGNTAAMNGDKLEPWYSCPECGHEGFKEDMAHVPEGDGCVEYLASIGIPDDEPEPASDDDAPDH